MLFTYIILGHPIVLTRCITNNKNRSVTLIGKVSETGENSKVHTVYWSKNGEKIENKVGERKYSKVTVQNPSLTINNVNHQDAGSYQFTAITSAGSQESEIVFGNIVFNIIQVIAFQKGCLTKRNFLIEQIFAAAQ